MAQILLVENDDGFRMALSDVLKEQGHQVSEADGADVAKSLMGTKENFDLVLTDVKMPDTDGIELLNWIKSEKPTRVVLMTGFTHLLGEEHAFFYGADGFLSKPFTETELAETLNRLLPNENSVPESVATQQRVEVRELDTQYCRVPISDFVAHRILEYDVYIKLSDFKFVKIMYAGSRLDIKKIEVFRKKGVKHLYIPREDFSRLVGFNLQIGRKLQRVTGIHREKKRNFMRYSGEVLMESAFIQGVSEGAFFEAKEYVEMCMEVLLEDMNVFSLLDLLNRHSEWIYAHSLGVGLYGVMIAKSLGWRAHSTLMRICSGGLFHDIGMKEVSTDVLAKPRHLQTHEERVEFESHPARGKQILEAVRTFPSDVVQIAYEHHEFGHGLGYPRRVSALRVHPLAKVIGVSNLFCGLVIHRPGTQTLGGADALKEIRENRIEEVDAEAFRALQKSFPNSANA